MNADIVSAVVAAFALLLSLYSTSRSAKTERATSELQAKAVAIQDASWRLEFGQELQELAFLLTQSQLLTQREQQRNEVLERHLQTFGPNHPLHEKASELRAAIVVADSVAAEQEKTYGHFRRQVDQLWRSPTADGLVLVQRVKASVRETLVKLESLEPQQRERYEALKAQLEAPR